VADPWLSLDIPFLKKTSPLKTDGHDIKRNIV
jgi:hypothetical protein